VREVETYKKATMGITNTKKITGIAYLPDISNAVSEIFLTEHFFFLRIVFLLLFFYFLREL